MLTNTKNKKIDDITKKDEGEVEIVYNQIPIVVKPGQDLDVRDFGVSSDLIPAVERHILMKNPNTFKQSKTEDVFKTAKAALVKIKELEKEIEDLKAEVVIAKKSGKGSGEEEAAVKAENEGLLKENKSLKESVKELKAQVKAIS